MQQPTNNIIDPSLYKRVVGYGCSFTAGDELIDHQLLNLSFDECNKIKKNFKDQPEFYKQYDLYSNQASVAMSKQSWAGQLATLLNLPYLSRAVPGSSMAHIYFKIYLDYLNKVINKDDLILVGITSPERIIYWHKNLSMLDSTTLSNYIINLERPVQEAIIDLYDDNVLIINYFSFLQNVSNLKNILNIRLQPMLGSNIPGTREFRYNIRVDFNKIIIDLYKNLDNILVRYMGLDNEFCKKYPRCGFNHPPIESHAFLAKNIYDLCVLK